MPITYVELSAPRVIKKRRGLKRYFIFVLSFFIVCLLVIGILGVVYFPKVRAVSADTKQISRTVEKLQKAVEEQNVVKAKEETKNLKAALEKTQTDLHKLRFVGSLPVVSTYYTDLDHGLRAAILGAEGGEILADSLAPVSDVLGLKGVENDLPADKKFEVLVTKVFPELSKKSDRIGQIIHEIKKELDYIDPDDYPSHLYVSGLNVKETLVDGKEKLSEVEAHVPSITNFLEAFPSVAGYGKEKTYMLWFQNDKEIRATGGFISAYGLLRVKDGKLLSVESDDIYQLDLKFTPFEPPPPILKKYLLLQIYPIRDTNMSPDFKVSSEKFESFYKRIKTMPPIDGIIAVDTRILEMFLAYTGPVRVAKYNETFSAERHPVYKMSDVVYKLELYAERILQGQRDRKGLVGDLMDEMQKEIFNAPPEDFPKILDIVRQAADEKHLLFYFHDKKAQAVVEDLNYGGRIKDYGGDYLHLNNANYAGLKGNLYTKSEVVQDINISSEGTVTKKVTQTIYNTEKADGWLNAVYQNQLRLFVPKGSKLINKKIFADFAEKTELDKTVWESFSRTLPLKSSESSFTYELPFKVKPGEKYKMLIQKQGGTLDPRMTINVNGKKVIEFDLKKDVEVEFPI